MSEPREEIIGLFSPYAAETLNDPNRIAEIVSLIELGYEDPITKIQAYIHGIHRVSSGMEVNGVEHARHPKLAIAMFKGFYSLLEHLPEEDQGYLFDYELTTVLQVATNGPIHSRDYPAALALVRELYPLDKRLPSDGMNSYEEYLLIDCLDELRRSVLPEAAETFTDIMLAEISAIQAGKSPITSIHTIEERIVTDESPEASWDDLDDENSGYRLTIDHEDGTLTQQFQSEEPVTTCLILELACQASEILPDLDILSLVIAHPDFTALSEEDQVRILAEFAGDASKCGHPEMIKKMIDVMQQYIPGLSAILQLELKITNNN